MRWTKFGKKRQAEFLATIDYGIAYDDPISVAYYKLKCRTYLFLFKITSYDGENNYYYGASDADTLMQSTRYSYERRKPIEVDKRNLESIIDAIKDLPRIL